jgi:hypothetical protein
MKSKITILEAKRLRACRAELSISQKITRALHSRRINFDRLHRLQDEHLVSIRAIGAAERAIRERESTGHCARKLTRSVTQAVS